MEQLEGHHGADQRHDGERGDEAEIRQPPVGEGNGENLSASGSRRRHSSGSGEASGSPAQYPAGGVAGGGVAGGGVAGGGVAEGGVDVGVAARTTIVPVIIWPWTEQSYW